MDIYIARSPYQPPPDNWVANYVTGVAAEFDAVPITESRPDISLAEALPALQRADAMIAVFEQPDEVLRDKVLTVHALGKSVLVGLDINLDPQDVLGEIAAPPYDPGEKRYLRVYYVYGEDTQRHALKVNRNGLSARGVKAWLGSQSMLH